MIGLLGLLLQFLKVFFFFSKEVISKQLINWEWIQKGKGVSKTGYFLTQPSLAFPDLTWPDLTWSNLTQSNPTQPNPTQPNPTQPNATQPNLT